MTDPTEHEHVPPDAVQVEAHNATSAKLSEQRLRLTAARDRVDFAANLLARGDDGALVRACEELRLARRALEKDEPDDE